MDSTPNQWTRRNFIKGSAGLSLAAIAPQGHTSVFRGVFNEDKSDPDFKFSWRIKPVRAEGFSCGI
jgi:hypothetical protein